MSNKFALAADLPHLLQLGDIYISGQPFWLDAAFVDQLV